MKRVSRKTCPTSLLFLELLQMQNLKRKSGGTWHIISPHLKKRGDTSPVFLTKLRPWSNVKSSSHKTWQTSYLVLKPLQIQTLREKSGGTWHIIYPPPLKKWWGHVPRVPHQIAPMLDTSQMIVKFYRQTLRPQPFISRVMQHELDLELTVVISRTKDKFYCLSKVCTQTQEVRLKASVNDLI